MLENKNSYLEKLKTEANYTYTENGAVTLSSSGSKCLDLFATIGALRRADDNEMISRFLRAYAENADLAVKTLFFARDIRGGLGERKVFRTIFRWLAVNEPDSCRKNISYVGEYGRYDDLLCLFGTPCEKDMLECIKSQLEKDMKSMEEGGEVSLLGKWLPSVNATNSDTIRMAKKIARYLGMNDASYRRMLTALRAKIKIIENNLRVMDYSFDYSKQPSKALYKYRNAFWRNDGERYEDFLNRAESDPTIMNTSTLTPYDIIAPCFRCWDMTAVDLTDKERKSMDITWNAQEDFTGDENTLVVVDGSGSMYWGNRNPLPAAVAQSLGIYFAERNKGAFRNYFITFSSEPRLVRIEGRDIDEKVRYCMSYDDCSNTDLEKVFDLILNTAVKNKLPQDELPARLYIISDMEFDCCSNAEMSNFENAKLRYKANGYKLPEVVFWNVESRNMQVPVSRNEVGVTLVSGCTPNIFNMLKKNKLDPYQFMIEILASERYLPIVA